MRTRPPSALRAWAFARARHVEVGGPIPESELRWQAAYLSPNEGGSGASAPLFLDFCTACLGRDALAVLASEKSLDDPESTWEPTTITAKRKLPSIKGAPLTWARQQLSTTKTRQDFEGDLVAFQRHCLLYTSPSPRDRG